MNVFKRLSLFFLVIFICSCASRKDVVYLQDIDRLNSDQSPTSFSTELAPNDLLAITVTADNMAAVQPFNLPVSTTRDVNDRATISTINQPYLVGPDGTIDFPKLGRIQVTGLSRKELAEKIEERLTVYVKTPRVDVRIQNFKVTVLGSVKNPGTFQINDERVTILEALGLAGDMTIYGERSNVLVLREEEGVKNYGRLDLTQSDFLDSPYYYLRQNDVVVIEQNKAEVQQSISNPNTGIYFSVASLLLSVLVILTR